MRNFTLAVLGSIIIASSGANAQGVLGNVPSMHFGEAELNSPTSTAVNTYYGTDTTHTNGLASARSQEIIALARNLKNDPILIFEYVHDNIDYYPTFGSTKGALGAHLDKSGTAIDQSVLMSELLDQARENGANIANIQIKYGTLNLNDGTQIMSWLDTDSADKTCRLLANGGIPALVNGGSNCSAMSGSVTSLSIAHSWISATVNGQVQTFDPAFKEYLHSLPMEVNGQTFMDFATTNCSSNQTMSSGAPSNTGALLGTPFAKNFNASGLKLNLDQCSENIWNWVEANRPEASVEDIFGDRVIKPMASGVFSLPQSHYQESASWVSVPDQYRLKYTVTLDPSSSPAHPDFVQFNLFADEISGKRVELNPNGFRDSSEGADANLPIIDNSSCGYRYYHKVRLAIEGSIRPGIGYQRKCNPIQRTGTIRIQVDAPYAAENGNYLDTDQSQSITFITRAVLSLSSGRISADHTQYANRGLGLDQLADNWVGGTTDDFQVEDRVPGELQILPSLERRVRLTQNIRNRIAKAWEENFTNLGELVEGLHQTKIQHHYTVGWVYGATKAAYTDLTDCQIFIHATAGEPGSATTCDGSSNLGFYTIADDPITMSLHSAVSTSQNSPEAISLRRTLAATAAGLEASIIGDQTDATTPGGTAHKFDWANKTATAKSLPAASPVSHIDGNPGPLFGVYQFLLIENESDLKLSQSAGRAISSILTSDGYTDCFNETPDGGIKYCYEHSLIGGITRYLNAGYKVVAAQDAYLGPGLRCGTFEGLILIAPTSLAHTSPPRCEANLGRGAAFIAYKPDFSDIAHISYTSGFRMSKGGASAAGGPEELSLVDLPTPADLLKEEEENQFSHNVDLRSGRLSFGSGTLISSGSGAFPFALSFSRTFQSGRGQPGDPVWDQNWNMPLSISSSSTEALGASRGLFAARTLALIATMKGMYGAPTSPLEVIKQETIGALAVSWWTTGFGDNTASASFNGQTTQFFRKLNSNTFYPTEGGAARLTQSGSRTMGIPHNPIQATTGHLTSLVWRRDNLSFTLKNSGQDTINYDFWRGYDLENWEYVNTAIIPTHPDKTGFRATNWDFPSGINITFDYEDCEQIQTNSDFNDNPVNTTKCKYKLKKVQNNIGRFLTFEGSAENPTAVMDDAGRRIDLTSFNVTHLDGKVTSYSVTGGTNKRLYSITSPGFAEPNHTFHYSNDDIEYYENALGNRWTYLIGGGRRGGTLDPFGAESAEYFDEDGNEIRSITRTGEVSTSEYDGLGRLTKRTMPEGDYLRAFYDDNSNVIRVEQTSKNNSQTLITTAIYNTTWNTPTKITDPKGNVTDITINTSGSAAGQPSRVEQPADENGVRPTYTYDYDNFGRLTRATDPVNTVSTSSYGSLGVFEGATMDAGGLNIQTTITQHTPWGVPEAVDGPRNDVLDNMAMQYDIEGRDVVTIGADPDGSGPLPAPVTVNVYDAKGLLTKTCTLADNVALPADPVGSCAAASRGQ